MIDALLVRAGVLGLVLGGFVALAAEDGAWLWIFLGIAAFLAGGIAFSVGIHGVLS